jgi:TATA-box binding protein (TBP) (component of TFIID and TFIIIB)
MDLLQAAADDGTYSRHDIEKVLEKIRKRILDGHAMVDDETESDVENVIVKGGGGFG